MDEKRSTIITNGARDIHGGSQYFGVQIDDVLLEEGSKNEDFGELFVLAKEKGYASDVEISMQSSKDQEGVNVRKATQALFHLSTTFL